MAEPTLPDRVDGSPQLHRRQSLVRHISNALGQVEIHGLASVPDRGPVLLAMNHRSLLDGPLLFGAVHRPVSCLVKVEAFTPRMGPLLRSSGQIPVRRDVVDAAAVRLCLRILGAGGVVGIFPEGTRGHGLVETAKPGVGYLGLRTGAAIVPVACSGTSQMAHRRSWARPPAVLLFGEAIAVDRWPQRRVLKRSVAAAATEQIRVALAALVTVADDLRAGRGRGRPTTTTTERARD
ncbi:MAG: 1-acyl-sn-glycerol-3-phosphate acyltransferase [Pseudonocardiales bacterium]|nr:MAG: 1-acyl-sn-glycerol-3-phosphate acyltransferase [Pseudonocardiales bacterium]